MLYAAIDPRLQGGDAERATPDAAAPLRRRRARPPASRSLRAPATPLRRRGCCAAAAARAALSLRLDAVSADRDRHPEPSCSRRARRTGSAPTASAATSRRCCSSARGTRSWSASSRSASASPSASRSACSPRRARGWVEELVMRARRLRVRVPGAAHAIMLTAIYGPGPRDVDRRDRHLQHPGVRAHHARRGAARCGRATSCSPRAPAARARWRITLDHVLPNIAGVLIVQATIQFATAILAEAALSLSRPRHAAAASRAGAACSTRRRRMMFQAPLLRDLARPRDRAGGARPEPAGRRAARPARPAAGAQRDERRRVDGRCSRSATCGVGLQTHARPADARARRRASRSSAARRSA